MCISGAWALSIISLLEFCLKKFIYCTSTQVEINYAGETDDIFDAISYKKGASVIRMLQSYLGPECFQVCHLCFVCNYLSISFHKKQIFKFPDYKYIIPNSTREDTESSPFFSFRLRNGHSCKAHSFLKHREPLLKAFLLEQQYIYWSIDYAISIDLTI